MQIYFLSFAISLRLLQLNRRNNIIGEETKESVILAPRTLAVKPAVSNAKFDEEEGLTPTSDCSFIISGITKLTRIMPMMNKQRP